MAKANGGMAKVTKDRPVTDEGSGDKAETPKLLPVQEFELVVNQYLMRKDMSPAEVVGFLELKLIEVKENWRNQVNQRIQAIQN